MWSNIISQFQYSIIFFLSIYLLVPLSRSCKCVTMTMVQAVFLYFILFTYILHYVCWELCARSDCKQHYTLRSTWNCSKVNNRWIGCCWVLCTILQCCCTWEFDLFTFFFLYYRYYSGSFPLWLFLYIDMCHFHVVFLFQPSPTLNPVVGLHRWTHKMYDNLHMNAQRVAFKEHTQHFNIKKNTVNFLTFSEIKRWYRFAFIDRRISIHGEKWIAFL